MNPDLRSGDFVNSEEKSIKFNISAFNIIKVNPSLHVCSYLQSSRTPYERETALTCKGLSTEATWFPARQG